MEQHTHEHAHSEERTRRDWRSYRGRGGRVLWGLLLSSLGGFWLVTNLTDNAALITENPGRVVFPALVILLGLIALFFRREPPSTDTK